MTAATTTTALSPAQQAIWYEEQVRAGNTGSFSVTLTGPLDESHLRAACTAVVRRHPPLRTVVRLAGTDPVAEVLPPTTPPAFQVADVPCPPGAEPRTARRWRDRVAPFDLTTAPGIAFALLRHAADRRTLLVVVHHFCFDGRSKFLFARDFTAALTTLHTGAAAPHASQPATGCSAAAPPPAQAFSWPPDDPAARHRAVTYWQHLLPDHPPLRLPRGTTNAAAAEAAPDGSPAGATVTSNELIIDAATRDRLAELAAGAGTTLFGALLATLAAQFNAYGNDRVAVAIPVDVSTPATRDLIGLAINVVPVAVPARAGDTFLDLLAATAAATDHLRATRRVPFRALTTGVPWPPAAATTLSRLSLSYLRIPPAVGTVPGLTTSWDFVAPNTARTFGLMFHLRDAGTHLILRVDHATPDPDASAATTIATHFHTTATHLAAHPTTPLHAFTLEPRTTTPPSGMRIEDRAHPLAAICAAGAVRDPGGVAVAGATGELTYQDLADLTADSRAIPDLAHRIAELTGAARAGGAGTVAPPVGQAARSLHWLARRLTLPGGVRVRTPGLARPGTSLCWDECYLTWILGGTLHLWPHADPTSTDPTRAGGRGVGGAVEGIGAVVARWGMTTVVGDGRVVRGLETGTLRDVVTSVTEVRPWPELVALVEGGVRVHARYATDRAGTVAVSDRAWRAGASLRAGAVERAGGGRPVCGAEPVPLDVVPGVRVEVCTGDGRPVPVGVTGELVVDGWCTGELGWLAETGALHVEGREALRRHGLALNAAVVERRLIGHPAVADATVTVTAGQPYAEVVLRQATPQAEDHADAAPPVAEAVREVGAGVDGRGLRRYLRRRVGVGEVPVTRIRVVGVLGGAVGRTGEERG